MSYKSTTQTYTWTEIRKKAIVEMYSKEKKNNNDLSIVDQYSPASIPDYHSLSEHHFFPLHVEIESMPATT